MPDAFTLILYRLLRAAMSSVFLSASLKPTLVDYSDARMN
jgi:hypothetical protein